MRSSSRLTLLILINASAVLSSSSVIEEIPTPYRPLRILEYAFSELYVPFPSPPADGFGADGCLGGQIKRVVADDADMRMMMGRWFIGVESPYYHRKLKKGHKCVMYEFERLIMAHNTTFFDVTLTYQSDRNTVRKDFGYMRSSAPRNAMLKYFSSTYESGDKFWIYKIGPEGRDSFGRLQYEYAIISGCYKMPTILARNPQLFKEKYKKEVLDWLDDNGFGIQLIQPAYFGCYFDSVAQIMGASDEGSGVMDSAASSTIRPSVDMKPARNNSCDTTTSNITLADDLDMRKMMGRWFEGISSLPTDNRTCIVHEYRRLEMIGSNYSIDGHYNIRFEIEKTYREAGQPLRKERPRPAYSTDQEIPKFNTFWIYKVGPEGNDSFGRVQYEYVILSNCDKSYVQVLAKNPGIFKEKHMKNSMIWLEENDFNTATEYGIIQPDYTSCHFTDSITPVKGWS